MTFGLLLKKAISFFLMPFPFGMVLLLLGIWKLYQNRTTTARRFLVGGIVWIFLFSYGPFANLLMHSLESRYNALLSVPKNTAYIYVLGYGHHTNRSLSITSQVDKEAIIRLTEGIRLYQALHGKAKLILSGYSGLHDPTPHAIMQQKLALSWNPQRSYHSRTKSNRYRRGSKSGKRDHKVQTYDFGHFSLSYAKSHTVVSSSGAFPLSRTYIPSCISSSSQLSEHLFH